MFSGLHLKAEATQGIYEYRDSAAASFDKFDHPFSSRFDEQDAFVIFDNVEVPRDHLFIDCNLAAYNSVMKTSWWPNIMQQT
jgi:4-hydroxyphenylacetate 3-monooxygenase